MTDPTMLLAPASSWIVVRGALHPGRGCGMGATVKFGPKPFETVSFSRMERLAPGACRRSAWLHVFASWTGWGPLRPGAALRYWAYRLRNLTTVPLVVGQIIHDAFTGALERAAAGKPLPEQGDLYAAGERRLLAVLRTARTEFLRSPKHSPMYWQSFYGLPTRDAVDCGCQSLDRGLARMLTHPVFDLARAGILVPTEPFAVAPLRYKDGHEIALMSAADGVVRQKSHLDLVELKTGRVASARRQLALNAAWWAASGRGWSEGRYRGTIVAVGDDEPGEVSFVLTSGEVAEVAGAARAAAKVIAEANAEPRDLPDPAGWPMLGATDRRCRTCFFLALCERDRAINAGEPPPFALKGFEDEAAPPIETSVCPRDWNGSADVAVNLVAVP